MMDEPAEPVQVFVRIRPENEAERSNSPIPSPRNSRSSLEKQDHSLQGVKCVSMVDLNTIRLTPPDQIGRKAEEKLHTFDRVFSEESTQEEIYQHVSTHVRATVNGYNTTIFAYGSTGSGKSYTMTGCSIAPGQLFFFYNTRICSVSMRPIQSHCIY